MQNAVYHDFSDVYIEPKGIKLNFFSHEFSHKQTATSF